MYKYLSNSIGFFFNILEQKDKVKYIFFFFLVFLSLFIELIGVGVIFGTIVSFLDESVFEKLKNIPLVSNEILKVKNPYIYFLFFLLLIYIIKAIYLNIITYLQYKFVSKFIKNISNKIFSNYLYQPYIFFLNRSSSDLEANLSLEINKLAINVFNPLVVCFTESFFVIGILIVLFWIQPSLVILIIFLASFLFYIVFKLSKSKIYKVNLEKQLLEREKIGLVKNGINAIKEIKIFNSEELFLNEYNNLSNKVSKQIALSDFYNQIPRIWIEFFAVLTLILTVFFLKIQNFVNTEIIQIIGITGIAVFKLLPSFNKIIVSLQLIVGGDIVIRKINNDLNLSQSNFDYKQGILNKENLILEGNYFIEFKDLCFNYKNTKTNIDNINFSIKKNDFIGIIGESGSGKSTLCDLILGFLNPDSGDMFINQKKVEGGLKNFKNIGYVAQSNYLLDVDIVSNITFNNKLILDLQKINYVLELVELNDFVKSLKNGIYTKISDRGGLNLSGGQRQRLSLARAIYTDPEILILDEGTNALDYPLEKRILNNILNIFKNKTIIFITHRLENLNLCNKVYQFVRNKNNNISLLQTK
jgi:ABC-type multidrug transport system fused ATPase/permease subunit